MKDEKMEKLGDVMESQFEKLEYDTFSQDEMKMQNDISSESEALSKSDIASQKEMLSQRDIPSQKEMPSQSDIPSQNGMSQQNNPSLQNSMPQQNNTPLQNSLLQQKGMPFQSGISVQNNMPFNSINKPKEVAEMVKTMQRDYWQYIGMAALFAVMFVFCLYKNVAGITAPFFTAGTLGFLYYFAKKNNIPIKKSAVPISIAFVGFGISCFLTNNGVMIFYNYIAGIFLVALLILLHLYDTKDWNMSDYIVQLFFMSLIGIAENMLECFPMYKAYKKEYAAKKEGTSIKNTQLALTSSRKFRASHRDT